MLHRIFTFITKVAFATGSTPCFNKSLESLKISGGPHSHREGVPESDASITERMKAITCGPGVRSEVCTPRTKIVSAGRFSKTFS